MLGHPPVDAALERRIALFGARIGDPARIERGRLPVRAADLFQADRRADQFRNPAQGGVAFREQPRLRLLGGGLVDLDAAQPHFQQHRQQLVFEPVGFAQTLAFEDREQLAAQFERLRRIGRGIGTDKMRRQLPDVGRQRRLLADLEAGGLARFLQQRRVLAGQAVAFADRVEIVLELVLVDQRLGRADVFEPRARRHQDAGLAAQPAEIIDAVEGDELRTCRDMILDPLKDLLAIEIVAVGMRDREIVRLHFAFAPIGDADAADVAAVPWPGRADPGGYAVVLGLDVEPDLIDAAQIGQLGGRLPIHDRSPSRISVQPRSTTASNSSWISSSRMVARLIPKPR